MIRKEIDRKLNRVLREAHRGCTVPFKKPTTDTEQLNMLNDLILDLSRLAKEFAYDLK